MKVRLTLDVDAADRFVIAKFFATAAASKSIDRRRLRATRAQVRWFAQAALRTHVGEQAERLRGKSRAVARRLLNGESVTPRELAETLPPAEQRSIPW